MRIPILGFMSSILAMILGLAILTSCGTPQPAGTVDTKAQSKAAAPASAEKKEEPALKKIKFALAVKETLPYFPAFVAAEKGIWKKNGIDAEIVPFKGAGPQLQALAAGEIQIGTSAALNIGGAAAKGVQAKVVAEIKRLPANMVLIVLDKSPIQGFKDMKGKKLGITSFGSSTDFFAQRIASSQGWDPQEGLTRAAIGGLDTQTAALLKGETDAMMWTYEGAFALQEKTPIRIVGSMDQVVDAFSWENIFASEAMIKNDPDTVKKTIKGFVEAIEWMRANKAEAVKMAAAEFGMGEAVLEKVYDKTMPGMTKTGEFDQKGMEAVLKALVDVKVVEKLQTVDQVYNTTLLK